MDNFNGLLSLDRKIDQKSAGAYLISSSSGSFPIFYSINDYDNWGMSNIDDKYVLLPGYKIIVYTDADFTGLSSTLDNTSGATVRIFSLEDTGSIQSYINRGSSCKLYFKNELLNGP